MNRALAVLVVSVLAVAASAQDAPPPAPPPEPAKPKSAFWTDAESALLDRGLEVLNCSRADMGFQKRPIEDPFRLSVVNRALDDPLSVGDEAQAWDVVAKTGDPSALLERAWMVLGSDSPGVRGVGGGSVDPSAVEACLPPNEQVVQEGGGRGESRTHYTLLRFLLGAEQRVLPSFDLLFPPNAGDRGPFLRKALLSQVEKPARPPEAADLKDDEFLGRARSLGITDLARATGQTLLAAGGFVRELKGPHDSPSDRWTGRRRFDPGGGPVVLYGYGDDIHDEAADADAVLVIDLGGNDTWTRGATASLLGNHPVSVCIDVAGNDRYLGREDLSFGAALGGVAIQWDCAGDDIYDAGHASLGAGICGVGILVDEGGDDIYRCRDFGLGAGAFGIGILLDKGGNDLYHGDLFGEGFASTRGCGVLVDMDGNDVYDAGGAHIDTPLYNDRTQSLSQGFSIGMRPDASGGVGVLVDLKGNDRYMADIYGQGASYWYSLGILVDDEGNDTYNLGQYGQGSGIHLSAGILVDRAGSDLYYLKNGVGMGGAHDYSVGMLVDRGGDDYYAGSGGTQGGALTNSVALLFDGGGNDGYAVATEGAQGYAAPARGTGGIGLLLDAGGKDTYSEWTRDGTAWTKDLMGAGLDEPVPPAAMGVGDPGTTTLSPEQAKAAVDKDGTVPGPDGKPVDDLDKLWAVASRWEVGDNRIIVPVAKERLVALGKPALDRALERVGTKEGLEYRAVETTLAKFPIEEVVPRLVERTREPEMMVRKGAVRALAGLQAMGALDRLVEMLATDPDTRGTVLSALAGLKKAPPAVAGLVHSPKEGEGVQAVLCLAGVGDAAAVATLVGALGPDTAFPQRTAAMDRLAALGEKAVPALTALVEDEDRPVTARRNALRALGRSKCAEAMFPVVQSLAAGDRLLRLSAIQAAGDLAKGVDPENAAALAEALAAAREKETDPLLRRMR